MVGGACKDREIPVGIQNSVRDESHTPAQKPVKSIALLVGLQLHIPNIFQICHDLTPICLSLSKKFQRATFHQ